MLKDFLGFYASVGRSLDRKLYEPIYIRTSMINQCHYCLQHHLASSKCVGLTANDWKALKAGDYSRLSEKEQTVVAYAEKLTHDPHSVDDADFLVLKKEFNDAEIVDIDLLTGVANLTNRFTDPLGLEVEFPEEKIQKPSPMSPTSEGAAAKGRVGDILGGRFFQLLAIPFPKIRSGIVGALQKLQQPAMRRIGPSHVVVHQQEFL
jgi:AhpD family alkylhydroperoxidase